MTSYGLVQNVLDVLAAALWMLHFLSLFRTSATGTETLNQKLGQVAWLRGMLAARRGAVTETLDWAEQAFALLPPDDYVFRGGVLIIVGRAEMIRGRLVEAQRAYEQAAEYARLTDHWFLLSGALGLLAPVQLTLGALHAAAVSCQQLLALPISEQALKQLQLPMFTVSTPIATATSWRCSMGWCR